jgi:hypothetical protein
MNGPTPNPIDTTTLKPRRPPGRRTRKARAFETEIVRLRAEGYTFEAIREALAAAGVQVGLTTVKREAARRATRLQIPKSAAPPPRQADVDASTPASRRGLPAATPAVSSLLSHSSLSADRRSGKEIAEDFVRNRIANPLIRHRS